MPAVKFGPVLSDGRQQRIQSAGPHWVARAAYMISTADELREFRSYVTKMAGGAREFIMPIHDKRQAPWPTGVDWTTAAPEVEWDDAREFSVAMVRQQIRVQVTTVAAAGSTTMEIKNIKGGALKRGHYFTMVDKTRRARLYQIDEPPPTSMVEGQTGTVTFQPGLRSAAYVGQVLFFDAPRCTMTLDSPDSGIVTIEGNYIGRAELTLRESFGGL
jgi:hypothetical protein